MIIYVICATFIIYVTIKILAEIQRRKQRADLIAKLIAYHNLGTEANLVYACDKLMTDEEALLALISADGGISFGAGGALTITDMPQVSGSDYVAFITRGKRKIEFMLLQGGTSQLLRITEIGARGASHVLLEVDTWALLQALARINLIREEYADGSG